MQIAGYAFGNGPTITRTVGGGVGGVIYGYFKGQGSSGMLKSGLKGGGVGLAMSTAQSGLKTAICAGNDCSCGK
jgi:hypothetical protein